MPITPVRQNGSGGQNGSSGTLTSVACVVSNGANAGDTCIIALGAQLSYTNAPPVWASVTDSKGNTWTLDAANCVVMGVSASFGPCIASALMTNPLQPGDVVYVNTTGPFLGGTFTYNWTMNEFKGIASRNRVDQIGTATTGASSYTALTVALNANTTDPGDLVFGIANWWGSGGSMTNPSGWTPAGVPTSQNMAVAIAYVMPGSIGTCPGQFWWSVAAQANGCSVAYKPGSPSSGFFAYA